MQKKITESTAIYGLNCSFQNALHRVPAGSYAGRLAAVIHTAPGSISLSYSDAPGTSWSEPQVVAADVADGTADSIMDSAGNIHLCYCESGTMHLVTRKLTFADGVWSAGATVTVYDGSVCHDPSLSLAPDGGLWISYCRFVSPNRVVYIKISTDSGASWGTGSSDPGTQVASPSQFAHSQTIIDGNAVHVIYTDCNTKMCIRSRLLTGGDWSDEFTIASGSAFGRNFQAAVAADGRLGLAFYNDALYYREYDGAGWGTTVQLDSSPGASPQLIYHDNIPAVAFIRLFNGANYLAMYTDRKTGSFSTPVVLDSRARPFDSLLLYNATAESYNDRSSEAAGSATADVYHDSSGCLLKDAGDIVYLGMNERFRFVWFLLSTAGAGGAVRYRYWDGSNWTTFTPVGGNSDLGTASINLLLFDDYASVPTDWQKREVDGLSRFWIKIEVTSGFSTGPVGTQITAVSPLRQLVFRR